MIEKLINNVIIREGEFVNHPNDRGGATKYGITIGTLRDYRKDPYASAQDVFNLTKEEAAKIYKELFLVRPGIDRLADPLLMELVFDMAVHSGAKTAIKCLQKAVGAQQDGILGGVTIGVAKAFEPRDARKRFLAGRMQHIGKLLKGDRSQVVFASGWLDRLALLLIEYV